MSYLQNPAYKNFGDSSRDTKGIDIDTYSVTYIRIEVGCIDLWEIHRDPSRTRGWPFIRADNTERVAFWETQFMPYSKKRKSE